ncbi:MULTISPECIES: helix-turn-helix domain-containing protein [Salinibaculum]|uniref:helix-turn-helix domain-containing protein n=1 Tax=Salinibaculum TaxID=2732368 RepID=UPI0030D3A9FC
MEDPESGFEGSMGDTSKERTLQILFEVELPHGCSCPLLTPSSQVENVHNQVTDSVCHAEMTVSEDSDTTHVVHETNHVEQSCLCLAFSEVGCVPRIQSADGDTVMVETYVSDRETITELVDRLKSVTEGVSLRRLTTRQREGGVESNRTTVDISDLTPKQREAAMVAVSEGYYETPRQTSFDELAATLDISKSALSQRLSAIESKLATAVFDP